MELLLEKRSGHELDRFEVGLSVLLSAGGQAEDTMRFLWGEVSLRSRSSIRRPFRAICRVLERASLFS